MGAVLLLTPACGGGEAAPEPPPQPSPAATTAAPPPPAPEPTATAEAKPEPPKLPPVQIEPWPEPGVPEKIATTRIVSPKANQLIPADKAQAFEVKIEVKDWPSKPEGPHVHLILDNKPYKPLYEPKATVKLSDIAPGEPLAEGQHVLAAFPSRTKHVSLKPQKGKSPLAVVTFWVGKKGTPAWKPTDPTLIYSRPKGTYSGPDAENILLDFYLANAELGKGKHTVHATVTPSVGDPRSITIEEWKPFGIKNLPDGDSKVKLELRDKDGKIVPGAWNVTERTITVKREAAPADAAPAPAAGDAPKEAAPAGTAAPAAGTAAPAAPPAKKP